MQPLPDDEYQDVLRRATPRLRAFARMLSGAPQFADDLVHQTLMQAWAQRDSAPAPNTILEWLFRLLRNFHYSDARRTSEWARRAQRDEQPASDLAHDLPRLRSHVGKALAQLPEGQREVLILSVASGFDYRQVARIVGCAIGTVKSRLSRARKRMLEIDRQAASDLEQEGDHAKLNGGEDRPQLH